MFRVVAVIGVGETWLDTSSVALKAKKQKFCEKWTFT
jgi:hypothetical protein